MKLHSRLDITSMHVLLVCAWAAACMLLDDIHDRSDIIPMTRSSLTLKQCMGLGQAGGAP